MISIYLQTWGSVSGWTSTNVQSAGAIVAGLTAAEIQTLPIDADAMSAIGAYDIFASDQVNLSIDKSVALKLL